MFSYRSQKALKKRIGKRSWRHAELRFAYQHGGGFITRSPSPSAAPASTPAQCPSACPAQQSQTLTPAGCSLAPRPGAADRDPWLGHGEALGLSHAAATCSQPGVAAGTEQAAPVHESSATTAPSRSTAMGSQVSHSASFQPWSKRVRVLPTSCEHAAGEQQCWHQQDLHLPLACTWGRNRRCPANLALLKSG